MSYATARRRSSNAEVNKLYLEDRAVHDWYRFVLSFPPHLVREYAERFGLNGNHRVLDPFCGTGTTLVECKKLGISSVGIEANPVAHFASEVKTDWCADPDRLWEDAARVAREAALVLKREGIEDSPALWGALPLPEALLKLAPDAEALLLGNSISPLPLHKALMLLECLGTFGDPEFRKYELLALARTLVFTASNLHFGPEVGVGAPKVDAEVIGPWLGVIRGMVADLRVVEGLGGIPARVHHGDARSVGDILEPRCIDAVITSPPYPNEKDYTRTTRLESVVLGFLENTHDLRTLKKTLVRSNTRGIYREDSQDLLGEAHPEVERIATEIEERRVSLGKTSGFERMYARAAKLYFAGMTQHLRSLRPVLREGAQLAYVVGDQASYLRVMIRTGRILAEIAESLGYEVVGIDLFRTRLATATREQLREEVILLRWTGDSADDR